MTIHYTDDRVTLHHGDCLDVLRELPDCSVDSVVTDPPYGLGFMGKAWDNPDQSAAARPRADETFKTNAFSRSRAEFGGASYGGNHSAEMRAFQDWCELWAAECLRVLKPGGHMLAFGGSRTWHRLACAVEDAGFEIRDSIAWLYGSGFPKSLDVSKAIDKAARVEREQGEPGRYSSRRPATRVETNIGAFSGTLGGAASALVTTPATPEAEQWEGWGTALKPAFEPIVVGRKPLIGTVAANVLEHGTGALNIAATRVGSDEVKTQAKSKGASFTSVGEGQGFNGCEETTRTGRWPTNVVLDESQATELDKQTGTLKSGANPTRRGSDKFRDAYGDFKGQEGATAHRGADEGGASRFFPTFHYEAKAPTHERPRDGETAHPTVKPLELMQWLVKLVTPPGGTVLEPFAGSGTTAEACVIEHFHCIAIEREASYLPLIVARLTKPIQVGLDFGESA